MQARRRTFEPKSSAPPPTAYNVVTAPEGPAWSFPNTSRALEAVDDDKPAPGDYAAPVRPLHLLFCVLLHRYCSADQ
jgi:hypothetical protein